MKRIIPVLFIITLYFSNASANDFDYSSYAEVLKRTVENGLVDYSSIKNDPGLLNEFMVQLESVNADNFAEWTVNEQTAFWINAYNAVTLYGIVLHYPIEYGGIIARLRFPQSSIRQIGKFWDTVFVKVMGRDVTLNDIEHEILRKQYDDPRIHFALVCASIGCPDLINVIYDPESLDEQLDQVSEMFLQQDKGMVLDRDANRLNLSSIFEWYAEDFLLPANKLGDYNDDERRIINFVIRYISESDRKYIIDQKPDVRYLDYDWSLNDLIKP